MAARRIAARNWMQNWETIGDNLSKAQMEFGRRLNHRFSRANDLSC
jgi:hypothetical protein